MTTYSDSTKDADRPSERPVPSWMVLLVMLGIFLFYLIGSGLFLDMFTADELLKNAPTSKNYGQGYSSLLIWAGASFVATGIALILTIYGIARLNGLSANYRKTALMAFFGLALLSLVSLVRIGSGPLDAVLVPFCADEQNLCAATDKITIFLNWSMDVDVFTAMKWTKHVMNGIFQISALGVLTAFLFVASEMGVTKEKATHLKSARILFYCAATILTFVVLTDALFYEFVAAINGQNSILNNYYHGHVFYFALISSAVLMFVFAAGCWLDREKSLISGIADVEAIDTGQGESWAATIGKFTSNPSLAQGFATLAPIIAAFLGVWNDAG